MVSKCFHHVLVTSSIVQNVFAVSLIVEAAGAGSVEEGGRSNESILFLVLNPVQQL